MEIARAAENDKTPKPGPGLGPKVGFVPPSTAEQGSKEKKLRENGTLNRHLSCSEEAHTVHGEHLSGLLPQYPSAAVYQRSCRFRC